MTSTNVTARWGICGPEWRAIRPLRDRDAAYGWAYGIANGRPFGTRHPVDVYVDNDDGSGWTFVEHVAIGASR